MEKKCNHQPENGDFVWSYKPIGPKHSEGYLLTFEPTLCNSRGYLLEQKHHKNWDPTSQNLGQEMSAFINFIHSHIQ